MDSPLQALLNQSVVWATFTSRDGYGKPTYNDAGATTLAAYVSKRIRMVRDAAGKIVVSRSLILLDGIPGVGPEDKLPRPDGSTPPLLRVTTGVDEYGGTWMTRIYTE